MFQKRQAAHSLKPKKYVPILYTIVFFGSLTHLFIDLYNNETESMVGNVIKTCFIFSLALFTWIIFKKHSTLYKKTVDSKNLV